MEHRHYHHHWRPWSCKVIQFVFLSVCISLLLFHQVKGICAYMRRNEEREGERERYKCTFENKNRSKDNRILVLCQSSDVQTLHSSSTQFDFIPKMHTNWEESSKSNKLNRECIYFFHHLRCFIIFLSLYFSSNI